MCPNITNMSVIFHFSFLICFSNIIILTINVRMMEISSRNKTLFLAFIIHYSICLKSLAIILPSLYEYGSMISKFSVLNCYQIFYITLRHFNTRFGLSIFDIGERFLLFLDNNFI